MGMANSKLALSMSTVGKQVAAAGSNGPTHSLTDREPADEDTCLEEWPEVNEDFSALSDISLDPSDCAIESTTEGSSRQKPDEKMEEVVYDRNFEDLVEEYSISGGGGGAISCIEKDETELSTDVIIDCKSESIEGCDSSLSQPSNLDQHSSAEKQDIMKHKLFNNFDDLQLHGGLNASVYESDQCEDEFHDLEKFSQMKCLENDLENTHESGSNKEEDKLSMSVMMSQIKNSQQMKGDFQELEDLDLEDEMPESEIMSCGDQQEIQSGSDLHRSDIQLVGGNCSDYWEENLEQLGDFHDWEDECLDKKGCMNSNLEHMSLENSQKPHTFDWRGLKHSEEMTANRQVGNGSQDETCTRRDNASNIPNLEVKDRLEPGLRVEMTASVEHSNDMLCGELGHSSDIAHTNLDRHKHTFDVGSQQEVHASSLGNACELDNFCDFSDLEHFI